MKRNCIFIDLDGTVIKHCVASEWFKPIVLLPGVFDIFGVWEREGSKIILVTGRKESNRRFLESELERVKLPYDLLLMDCGSGNRFLINDKKGCFDSAFAVNAVRDLGVTKDWI